VRWDPLGPQTITEAILRRCPPVRRQKLAEARLFDDNYSFP
jgi:hypothetical protein